MCASRKGKAELFPLKVDLWMQVLGPDFKRIEEGDSIENKVL